MKYERAKLLVRELHSGIVKCNLGGVQPIQAVISCTRFVIDVSEGWSVGV